MEKLHNTEWTIFKNATAIPEWRTRWPYYKTQADYDNEARVLKTQELSMLSRFCLIEYIIELEEQINDMGYQEDL